MASECMCTSEYIDIAIHTYMRFSYEFYHCGFHLKKSSNVDHTDKCLYQGYLVYLSSLRYKVLDFWGTRLESTRLFVASGLSLSSHLQCQFTE